MSVNTISPGLNVCPAISISSFGTRPVPCTGPLLKPVTVLRRHPEHLGDDDDRQRVGEIVNDLEFASIAGLREHVFDDLPDARPQVLDGPRRERLADQAAQSCVIGRIGGQHRVCVAYWAILLLLVGHHLREARLVTTAAARVASSTHYSVDAAVGT